jgi:hypothetical protein
MSLISHAEKEMQLAWPDAEPMQDMIKANVLELLKVFADQGHSGMSAPYVLGVFEKLARFKPLTPLTGEDSEWMEVGDGVFQNIRCGEVFKEGKDGEAYWIGGKIFRQPSGCCYTGKDSRVPIVFPWAKTEPEIIDVTE